MEIVQIKEKFLHGIFNQNTYVLKNGNEALIIDAGAEVQDVLNSLSGEKVLAVLITHAHFDHIWNLEHYAKKFNCKIYICKGAENRFSDKNLNMSKVVKQDISVKFDEKLICHYDFGKLKIGSFELQVINTPGHSADSVCIIVEDNLFSGDTLFADGIGRSDFDDSNPKLLLESLKRIKNLNFKKLYPGHYDFCEKSIAIQNLDEYIF